MDLDSILDQALVDFENESSTSNNNNSKHTNKKSQLRNEENKTFNDIIKESKANENLGQSFQNTIKSLNSTKQGAEQTQNFISQLKTNNSTTNNTNSNLTALDIFNNNNEDIESINPNLIDNTNDIMINDMINQFEELGQREDYNEVIDGLMEQLLSKDLMYEPTKMMCQRYPEWLAKHKHELTEEKYNSYGKQYQTFQKLINVYDTEPDNYPRYAIYTFITYTLDTTALIPHIYPYNYVYMYMYV